VKIAICTPFYQNVHASYAYSLAKMMMHTVQAPIMFNGEAVTPQIELFMKHSSMLPTLRNELVADAIKWGANYLLWADSDHKFPPHALIRLLSLNLPVVGVNYARRTLPTAPTAIALNGRDLVWTTEERARKGEITEVSGLGMGLCLLDMTIFGALQERAHAEGRASIWPLFAFETLPDQMAPLGEDLYFFRQLREAGISLHVDHALSWAIGHSREQMIFNRETLLEKDAYEAKHGRSYSSEE
jgi:hypothetical protein